MSCPLPNPSPERFAVVVGHTRKQPGAWGVSPLGCYEYEYNVGLAVLIQELLPGAKVFSRDGKSLKQCYAEVDAYAPKAVVELHFNSFNTRARGTLTLHGEQAGSEKLALHLQNGMVTLFGRDKLTNRGILRPKERGVANVNLASCPSALVEPFFGDNTDDAILGKQNREGLAVVIAESLARFTERTGDANMGESV